GTARRVIVSYPFRGRGGHCAVSTVHPFVEGNMSEGNANQQAPGGLWCQASAGLLVLLAVGVLAYNFDDVLHPLREPPLVNLKDLDRAEQVSELPRGRVRMDCSGAIRIKLSLVGKRYGSDEEKARYLAVRTGVHYLIAEVPPRREGTVVEGALYQST